MKGKRKKMVSWTVILYILSRESLSYPVKNGGIHWEAKLVDCESLMCYKIES